LLKKDAALRVEGYVNGRYNMNRDTGDERWFTNINARNIEPVTIAEGTSDPEEDVVF